MKIGKTALIVAGILASAGLGFYGIRLYPATQAQTSKPSSPQTTPLSVAVNAVGALGRFEPQGEVIDVGGPSGDRILALLVKEGEWVTAGSELARLENYTERLAERNYAASQLAEAKMQLSAEISYSQSQIQEARTRVRQVDLPQLQQVEAQKATIRQLEAEFTDAQTDLTRFQNLFQEGAISQQELDDRSLVVQQKQEELNSARSVLSKLEQEWQVNVSNAEAQVRVAESNLSRVRSHTPIDSLTRNLELAEARLQRTIIRAPQNGQILKILTYAGETLSQEAAILQLGNTKHMLVVAEVYETDVPKIKLGQNATITGDAFPQPLRGTVDQIGLQIRKKDVLDTDPAADVDARVVEVKIRLDPESSQQAAALTNMQVTVAINL
jgi:HlyD family secretion protein